MSTLLDTAGALDRLAQAYADASVQAAFAAIDAHAHDVLGHTPVSYTHLTLPTILLV